MGQNPRHVQCTFLVTPMLIANPQNNDNATMVSARLLCVVICSCVEFRVLKDTANIELDDIRGGPGYGPLSQKE